MTLWAVFTLLLGLAVGLLLPGLLRRFPAGAFGARKEMAHFKAQLNELADEEARGAITPEAAEETRREIERRALAAAKSGGAEHVRASGDKTRLIAVGLAVGWVVLGSVILYSMIGSPTLQSAPRMAAAPADVSPIDRLAQGALVTPMTAPAPAPAPATGAQALADVDTMIARLAARLEEEPGDLEGWQMLGWSHMRMDNYAEAVAAYARAVNLAPRNAQVHAAYGDALVRSQGGQIDAAAMAAFDASLAANPNNALAAYYKGIAEQEAGNTAAAIDLWTRALQNAPDGAEFLPDLRQRMAALAPSSAVPTENLMPPQAAMPGPTADQVEAAQQMTAADRQQMIQGMVQGLAERLEDSPNDPEGWARLIRSYAVLNDPEAAAEALRRARAVFPAGSAQAQMVEAAAQAAGVN